MKKAGNDLLDTVGGRSVHPVNVRVGGFYRMPTRQELRALAPRLERARDEAIETVALVAGFDFPDMDQPYEYLSLRADQGYPIESGSVVTSSAGAFPVQDFTSHIQEFHVAHSNALHARLDGSPEPYVVGPLARYSLNSDRLGEAARAAATAAGLGPTCRNPFRSIIVRSVELVEAYSEALRIIDGWTGTAAPSVPVPPRAGEGFGASEAPRGTLFHRYLLDGDGIIRDAQIVPPTSQNQPSIEADLRTRVQHWSDLDDHALLHRCEQAIRNYDPCISCATHFLDLTVDRR
jgi:coenzyme F420-reducing hydrogenase alpha subunit